MHREPRRPACEIDGIVLITGGRLGAAEMNGKRGEGRAVFHLDRLLNCQLLDTKACDLAAPPAARRKGDHQDRPVTQIAQALRCLGRPHFC